MAIPKGLWDELALSEGWFDVTQKPEGWFDSDLLDTSVSGVTATLAVTEASDTVSSSASVEIAATLAVTESSDTVSSAASVEVSASLAVTESDDSLSSSATVSGGDVTATLSVTEDDDTASSSAEITGTGNVTVLPTGGWWGPRTRTRDEIDAERRRLGILPPVAEIARKSAQRAVQSREKDEQALRIAVESLRAEIGKKEAAALRDAYVQLVRMELQNAWIEQQQEEEAVAMTMIYLLAA